ncbi:RNA-guided endonuclease TnpB family protein [Enterococcus columbae]|uniref:IS605 OrfB family transposase n=1 Tax=Enterococcus columbae DSM 7374 = ATCC 51263 TaxID=1121865 RepID=S1NE09_9ENTE|nr:RNA-guided endonuclease TnpB family protein [Enterococcus columbae]EOT39868.1 IS605 OrfB family transposase [Enterococcus columbae DSM 7374 = ATCC 51263]EOW83853.1 IS605 OrfB family transposase [Enterococcus columbae DSM 7374 = ATCC 51263]OJG25325.1 IS605 OrfB family transposase [Enterococcus columbae DSM 7374 = ATCC 51263]
MKILKGYRFKIYPNEEQKRFFIQTFGCVRFTYNYLLKAAKKPDNRSEGKVITPAMLKRDYPFLKATDSLALANAARNLNRAFKNYFSGRSGYPKLKNKKSAWQSYTTNNQNGTVAIEGNQLKLPKLKERVMICCHRPVLGTIKSVTISAKNNQEFYVSLLCVEEVDPLPKTNREIQIYFHPEKLIADDLGQLSIQHLEQTQQKINKLTQRLELKARCARKRKVRLSQAKNYQKLKMRLAKHQSLQHNQLQDYLNQLSTLLIRKYDVINFVEPSVRDQQSAANVQEAHLFSLNEWHQLMRMLKYKASWYGKEFKVVFSTQA